ncbi:tetratricopeptide repeat protein [Ulvibacterium sp.]|uniref:SH3 domain-containing protein n=1 Tax=Ulvibacterium sp. TaxID=2665914 RepID=UPI00261F7146|nr:tetratricopeptide repeat protein [Ulvibacterium sp.]
MKGLAGFVLFWIGFWTYAQNEAIFEQATSAYNEGDYETAITYYLEILGNGEHSAALYFNLGNSYYKINQIAPSIYYYEKALLLKPNDLEIRNNLAYAQNMTLDAIDKMPETGFSKIYNRITGILSFDQWAIAAVVFTILFVLLYIAFFYFRYSSRKRIAFISGMISLIMALISMTFAFIQHNDFKSDRPAIIFSEEVTVKSEPNDRSQEVFTLHEGTKIHVLDSLNQWKKIRIGDGKTGWLMDTDIKMLKDF